MNNQHADQNDDRPLGELGPELRRVVERIAQEMPPEALVQQVLDRVRRQGPTDPASRPRLLEHRQGRRTVSWSFATVSAVCVAACAMVFFAISSSFLREPSSEVISQMPMAVKMPVAVNQDRPTVWAYRKALAESPEAMDALLARNARQILCPAPRPFQTQTFPSLLQPMP